VKKLLMVLAVLAGCASVPDYLARVESQYGVVTLHAERGTCEAEWRRAFFAPAKSNVKGAATEGCYLDDKDAGVVWIIWMDGDRSLAPRTVFTWSN